MVVKTEITRGTFDPRNYKVECQSYCYTVILHTGSDHETLEISKIEQKNTIWCGAINGLNVV